MSHSHNHPGYCSDHCGCCGAIPRRDFLGAAGLSALAAGSGFFTQSTAAAEQPAAGAKPLLRVVFLHPKTDRYWMGWPGACYDIKGSDALFTKTLAAAAEKFGVQLQLDAEPLPDMPAIEKLLAECKRNPPDGLIAVVGALHPNFWPMADRLAAEKGDLPLVLFSHMGTSFTPNLQATRTAKKCFVAATQDHNWLATAVRMIRTIWAMRNSRLCIINGTKTSDDVVKTVGTTLHRVPLARWTDELARQETTDEVRALADEFARTARKCVEPKPEDVLNAAKNYFVAKRIMAAENCDGISLNCLGLVADRKIPCPPCMAWMKLNDEGSVGCCECDWTSAISLRLCSLLLGRPGFMQDPAPNTVNGTLMGAHCSSPSRLRGFDEPPAPLILRSHSESEIGVSPQIVWPLGEPVTVMKLIEPDKMVIGTGQEAANIDTPPCGGCRTSVELRLDGAANPLDSKGFHQLFILGKHDRLLRAYCSLAGIEALPLA
jgi:hypothetical protein